jgi:hypothetical protein
MCIPNELVLVASNWVEPTLLIDPVILMIASHTYEHLMDLELEHDNVHPTLFGYYHFIAPFKK